MQEHDKEGNSASPPCRSSQPSDVGSPLAAGTTASTPTRDASASGDQQLTNSQSGQGSRGVDWLGIVIIMIGITYFALGLVLPELVRDPWVQIPIGEGHLSPLSLAIILFGGLLLGRVTFVIKTVAIATRALELMGLVVTRLGIRLHYAGPRAAVAILCLLGLCLLGHSQAARVRQRERSDNEIRSALIAFLDRHPFQVSERPMCIDLIAEIDRLRYSGFDVRRPLLWKLRNVLAELYDIDGSQSTATRAQFRKRLEDVGGTLWDKVDLSMHASRDGSTAVDALTYLTVLASIEITLSIDGTQRERVEKAMDAVRRAENALPQAQKVIRDRALPPLYTFDNVRGIAHATYALGRIDAFASPDSLARELEGAYDSFRRAQKGPAPCQYRALNNLVGLELEVVGDARVTRALGKDSPLGRAIQGLKREPHGWYEERMTQLTAVETFLPYPEIGITRLQVIGAYASQAEEANRDFCESEEWVKCEQEARRAIDRIVTLGFQDCSYFADPDREGLFALTLCDSEGSATLCEYLDERFKMAGLGNCQPCKRNAR